jgi:hypothetical protein
MNILMIITFIFALNYLPTSFGYPVESKPLNNNPDTWFNDEWLIFSPRGADDPSTAALIGHDPHVKKSKITPKSIFIAPNFNSHPHHDCPSGYRVDHNGKCIKIVKINQDELLAARISELFGISNNNNKNSDNDSYDYGDYGGTVDESKSEKDSTTGPLQINLPLTIDIEEENVDGKRVEYIIAEKVVSTKNENHEITSTTTATVEKNNEEITTIATTTSTLIPVTEESVSTTDETFTSSTVMNDDDLTTRTTVNPTTDYAENETTTESITTTEIPVTTTTIKPITSTTTSSTTTTTSTTQKPSSTTKIFSVDFLPKNNRKLNRQQISSRLKNSRDRGDKIDRPRKYKTTTISTKSLDLKTLLGKVDGGIDSNMKKNRTRNYYKRPNYRRTTTENIIDSTSSDDIITTTTTATTTLKPFWWLPRGWSIDESKDKPMLVRFWAQQPLQPDERARSHAPRQRANSRMPTDNIFREISLPEADELLREEE